MPLGNQYNRSPQNSFLLKCSRKTHSAEMIRRKSRLFDKNGYCSKSGVCCVFKNSQLDVVVSGIVLVFLK